MESLSDLLFELEKALTAECKEDLKVGEVGALSDEWEDVEWELNQVE